MIALRYERRDGGPGRRARRGAGPAGRRAGRPDVDVWPSAPTSSCSGPVATTATRCGRACSTARCSCATARRGPASTAACASPSAPPTRTTRFLAALRRGPRMTSRAGPPPRSAPPRRRRSRSRSTSTGPPATVAGQHRPAVLRPHARPARPPRRVRPASRPPATSQVDGHHTVEDVGILLGEVFARGARRQGRRPPVRQRACSRSTRRWSRSRSTCRAGRSSSTTCPSARCCRWATRRSTRRWPSTSGSRSPPRPASRCTCAKRAGRNTHHVVEASVQGRGPLPARRRAGRGRRRAVHQGLAVGVTP